MFLSSTMSMTVFDEKCLVILLLLSNTRHVMCVVVPLATQWIYSSHSYPIHPLSLIQPILFHAKLLDIHLFMTVLRATEWTKPRGIIVNHVDHSPFLPTLSAHTFSHPAHHASSELPSVFIVSHSSLCHLRSFPRPLYSP